MVTFDVTFDKPIRDYYPGEEVKCTWRVILTHPQKMRSIYVRYRGDAETNWSGSHTVSKMGRFVAERVVYHGDQNFFMYYQTLFGMRDGPEVTLPAGEYFYETAFLLPEGIPQNYEGNAQHFVTVKQ